MLLKELKEKEKESMPLANCNQKGWKGKKKEAKEITLCYILLMEKKLVFHGEEMCQWSFLSESAAHEVSYT